MSRLARHRSRHNKKAWTLSQDPGLNSAENAGARISEEGRAL